MFFNSIVNAAETGAPQGNPIAGLLPIVVIFAIFYFLIIRPQTKRAKEEKQMREGLQIGNKIVTTSGIFGTITEIDNLKSVVSVSIAKDVTIVMYKSSIANVLKEKTENGEGTKKIDTKDNTKK